MMSNGFIVWDNWKNGWSRARCFVSQEGRLYVDADPFGVDMSGRKTIHYAKDGRYKVYYGTGLRTSSGDYVFEGHIIEFDDTEIGGKKIQGRVAINNDRTLSRMEWGIWTDHGYVATDFLGKINIIKHTEEL